MATTDQAAVLTVAKTGQHRSFFRVALMSKQRGVLVYGE
jgi:hypothetical protein